MTTKISRILLATDFSKSAQQAQSYASQFAQALGADLHLLTIVVPPLPLPGPNSSWTMPETIVPSMITDAKAHLAELAKTIQLTSGGRIVCSVESGFPVEVIIDYTKKHQIDFLVIGTHGHRGLSRLLLGSVAEKIVRLAPCPVLTVHESSGESKSS
jgi:nucleotide-binding universal stress UspA family protein